MLVDSVRIVYVNFHRPICHRVFLYVTWHIRSIIPLRLSLGYLSFLMMGLGEEGHIDFHKKSGYLLYTSLADNEFKLVIDIIR